MKLTKLERHTAYILLLEELRISRNKHMEIFMCNIFEGFTGMEPNAKLLPELFNYKPRRNHWNGGWFSCADFDKRVRILEKCIKQTA